MNHQCFLETLEEFQNELIEILMFEHAVASDPSVRERIDTLEKLGYDLHNLTTTYKELSASKEPVV